MNLTEQETRYIQKHIRNLEKEKKYWPWFRWLILLASLASMCTAIYTYYILHNFQGIFSSVLSTPPKKYNWELINLFIEGNMVSLRMEYIFFFRSSFQAIFGIILFVYSLANWNRHIKQSIMIKVIQDLISQERQEN